MNNVLHFFFLACFVLFSPPQVEGEKRTKQAQ